MVLGAPPPSAAAGSAVRSLGLGGLLTRPFHIASSTPCAGAVLARGRDPPVHGAFTSPLPRSVGSTIDPGACRPWSARSPITLTTTTTAAAAVSAAAAGSAGLGNPTAECLVVPVPAEAAAVPAAAAAAAPTAAAEPASAPAPASGAPRPAAPAPVVVLGIESSCDDTGVAVVTSDGRVLGEAIATQADVHAQWGGVVPNLARDAHAAAIDRTVDLALAAAGLRPQQLSAIAVTIGPGLGLCLRVGASKARSLARQYGIPLVSVHHMEAHALVARMPPGAAGAAPPAIRLATALVAPVAPTSPSAAPSGAAEGAGDAVEAAGSSQVMSSSSSGRGEALASSSPSSPSSSSLSSQQQMQFSVRQEESPTASCDGGAQGREEHGQLQQPPQQQQEEAQSLPAAACGGQSDRPGPSGSRCDGSGGSTNGVMASGGPAAAAASAAAISSSPPGTVDAAAVLADVGAAAAVPFPFLCLLISGGHNLLVLVRGVGQYVQLGTSVDDALGEAYDKIARLLNLELRPHGGAALEALAREGDPRAVKFAVPMRRHATCDFSFAGLKTNTRLAIEQRLAPEAVAGMTPEQVLKVKADIAASFQSVAVTHLIEKSRRGVTWARELVPELRHLVVAGGVACNKVVRGALQELADKEGLELVLPPPRWCTDNGVMVAWAGIERLAQGWAEPPPPPLAHQQHHQQHHQQQQQPQRQEASPQAHAHAQAEQAAGSVAAHHSVVAHSGGSVASNATTTVAAASQPTTGEGPTATSTPTPAAAGAAATTQIDPPGSPDAEWIELKPRWPLTSEVHPRIAAARQEERRSVKKVRMAVPLSDLAPPSPSQPPLPLPPLQPSGAVVVAAAPVSSAPAGVVVESAAPVGALR